jgi:hypothetical protein
MGLDEQARGVFRIVSRPQDDTFSQCSFTSDLALSSFTATRSSHLRPLRRVGVRNRPARHQIGPSLALDTEDCLGLRGLIDGQISGQI